MVRYQGAPGVRRDRLSVVARDPVLVGPVSPFGVVDTQTPLELRTSFLPPRLSTFELETDHQTTTVDGWVIPRPEKQSLHIEYVSAPEDAPERHMLACPLIKLALTITNPQGGIEYPGLLLHGPPSWFYVVYGDQTSVPFTLQIQGKEVKVLSQLDEVDHFKLVSRAAHPQSDMQYASWIKNRIALVRIEELGLPGELKQWEDRFPFDYVPLESSEGTISVYVVYTHHVLLDDELVTSFQYMNK